MDFGDTTSTLANQWDHTRHGSHAGRGFRFQDAVATHVAILGWAQRLPIESIQPEGLEDISVRLAAGWLHLQVKSRRVHRGLFSFAEVSDFLVIAWKSHQERVLLQPDAVLGLILERGVHGLPPTGWGQLLETNEPAASLLRNALQRRLDDPESLAKLLESTWIAVVDDPRQEDLAILSESLQLVPGACVLLYQALLGKVGRLADENGTRPYEQPAELDAAEIQQFLDRGIESLDLNSLDLAIRDGICEVADFYSPLEDPKFYEGVDVAPGHVAAGLTVTRPEVDEILEALVQRQVVLVTGPSGTGKSATAWMSAFGSRHWVRWYRVKRLRDSDVPTLMRLARSLRSSRSAPIGLVIDDLGQSNRDGWDLLVTEVGQMEGIHLLGVARSEDLIQLATAPLCHQVQPKLTESIASAVWEQLFSEKLTEWSDWREPFSQSNGLLLEYGHLLTTGTRLASVIAAQIDRRRREHRNLELRALRLVSSAAAWGASLSVHGLRQILLANETDEDLQLAVERLLVEHLIHKADIGSYTGIHRLRSRQISYESHRTGIPPFEETVATLIELLEATELRTFLTEILIAQEVHESVIIKALTIRATKSAEPQPLISALQSLRLVGFYRVAAAWPNILEQEGVPPSKQAIAIQLALIRDELDSHFLPSIQNAVKLIAKAHPEQELRELLLAQLPPESFSAVVSEVRDLTVATELLAVLAGVAVSPEQLTSLRILKHLMNERPVSEISLFLAVARSVSVDLSLSYANAMGGPKVLLSRLEQEEPWLSNVYVADDDRSVYCSYRYVYPPLQMDPHTEVVNLCKRLLACSPASEIAECQAIDASGAIAGYGGVPIARKHIQRENLPTEADIAWNRLRTRTALSLITCPNETQRLFADDDLITATAHELTILADRWCRGQPFPASRRDSIENIIRNTEQLRPPPIQLTATLDPLSLGTLFATDPIETVAAGTLIQFGHLLGAPENYAAPVAFIHDRILPSVLELQSADHWRLIPNPPMDALRSLEADLRALHAVAAELHTGKEASRKLLVARARRGRASRAQDRSAELARQLAHSRLEERIQCLLALLDKQSLSARVIQRPWDGKGVVWPPVEILVVVSMDSVFEWPSVVEKLVTARKNALNDPFDLGRTVLATPEREGKIVTSMGGIVMSSFYPTTIEISAWDKISGFLPLEERASLLFSTAIDALNSSSGILGHRREESLHSVEAAAKRAADVSFTESLENLRVLAGLDTTGLLANCCDSLSGWFSKIQMQSASEEPTFAANIAAISRAESNDTIELITMFKYSLVEWDIDPSGLLKRIRNAFSDITNPEANNGPI